MTRPSNIPSFNMPPIDRAKSIVVGLMVVAGLLSWIFVRQAIAPIDSFFTEYACAQHGNTLLREVEATQRSNRFGLISRTEAVCFFGPIEIDPERENEIDPELLSVARDTPAEIAAAPLTVPFVDFEPTPIYRVIKIMGIAFQLGVVSFAVRLVGEPLLDRFGRSDPDHVG